MTLKIRRYLLNILLVPGLLLLALTVLVWIAWSRGLYPGDYNIPAQTAAWWDTYRGARSSDLLWSMAGLSLMVAVPLGWELLSRRRFGRSPSPEMFFLRLFLLTLPLQALRFGIPLALNGTIDIIWAVSLTKAAWFARLLGMGMLLNVGLYSGEIPFRRSGAILGTTALAVLAISVMIPMDSTQPLGNLLVRSGSDAALSLILVTVEILSVLTLVGTGWSLRQNRYYLLAAMQLLIVAGTDMAFFTTYPLLPIGLLLIIGGTIGFAAEIRKIYLWV